MRESKEKVESAILFFAKLYGQEDGYKSIMATHVGLPKLVEMISYEMFLKQFSHYYCDSDQYDNYHVLLKYAKELKEKGWVEFDKAPEAKNSYAKCFDKFEVELHEGDVVDVQKAGEHKIYKKEDGQLYFSPYGKEDRVSEYFSNDMIKVS